MLTLKNQQNDRNSRFRSKLAFISLVLALVVLIQPIFAAKNRSSRNSNRASRSRQQTQRTTSAPRPSTNTRRTQSRSAPSRPNTRAQTNIRRQTTRNNNRSTARPSVPTNTRPNRQVTNNRRNITNNRRNPVTPPRTNTNIQRQSSNTPKTPDPRATNANRRRNPQTNSNQNITANRNSRNSNSTTTRNQTIQQNTPRTQRRSIFSNLFRNKKTENSNTTQNSNSKRQRTSNIDRNSLNSLNSRSIAEPIKKQDSSDTISGQSITRNSNSGRRSRNERSTSIKSLFDRINARKNAENNRTDSQNSRRTRNIQAKNNENEGDSANNTRSSRSLYQSLKNQRGINKRTDNNETRENGNSIRGRSNRTPSNSRQRNNRSENRATTLDRSRNSSGRIDRENFRERARKARAVYHDRPNLVRHSDHNVYTYRDRSSRLRYRIVRPRSRYIISYGWGQHSLFRPFYPYYHRKYIFVSLGGWWPWDYTYTRYYWYGCHPYYWYGYYPVAREVYTGTYNYYTYNYYGVDDTTTQSYPSMDYLEPVDENTFADVREKLAQQQAEEPAEPTLADMYFENAVKAFESGDYNSATEKFAQAMEFAPEDKILPFAYCQALMANARYTEAASALRTAMANVDSKNEGVFYPRGLYSDDETLFTHIDSLIETAELNVRNADLQLLLGYQLLGLGETQQAAGPLLIAANDPINAEAAAKLLELLEKIEQSESETPDTNSGVPNTNTNTGLITPVKETISSADSISPTPQLGLITDEMYAADTKETALLAVLFTLATGSGAYHYFKS